MKRETLHNRRVICCDSVRRATPSIAVTRCKLTTKTKITPGSPDKHFLSQIDNTPSLCNDNGPAEREGRDVVGKEMDATICRGTYLEINLHPPNFAIRARGAGNQSLFSFPSSFHHWHSDNLFWKSSVDGEEEEIEEWKSFAYWWSGTVSFIVAPGMRKWDKFPTMRVVLTQWLKFAFPLHVSRYPSGSSSSSTNREE